MILLISRGLSENNSHALEIPSFSETKKSLEYEWELLDKKSETDGWLDEFHVIPRFAGARAALTERWDPLAGQRRTRVASRSPTFGHRNYLITPTVLG